jgi:hypothetical protein
MHTRGRRPVFRTPAAAHAVVRLRARTLPFGRASWLAWVLMPDHWQGLLVGEAPLSPLALAGRFKAMTARAVAAHLALEGWLWEAGCGVRELAPGDSLADAARRLVAAPRRAGLVVRLDDYPYWASAWPAPPDEGDVEPVPAPPSGRLIDPARASTIGRCRSP